MSSAKTRCFNSFAKVIAPIAFVAVLSGPALADELPSPVTKSKPTVGLGLSFAFGAGKVEPSVGVRVFSGNVKGHGVATLGLDYVFGTQRVRPTIGAAILGTNSYFGIDMGYSLGGGGFDFGIGAGGLKTAKPSTPADR
jgi:hypothetical protein